MKNDVIIIGAGIVGLATGVNLIEKDPGFKVLILEKENRVEKVLFCCRYYADTAQKSSSV